MRQNPELITFTYPTLTKGKSWFINFMAYDKELCKMRRKRIKLNHIKDVKQRARYAANLIRILMNKLDEGWNPWDEPDVIKPERHSILDVFSTYLEYISHSLAKGTLRKDSEKSYRSYLKVFQEWITDKAAYMDEIKMSTITEFLDYIYIEKENSSTTRNNYLVWLGNFFEWALQHGFVREKPTAGIKSLPKPKGKNRTIIDDRSLTKLHEYCNENNPHYLLAVQLILYCFIRPKELSMLRIQDINLKQGTITIPSEVSKNHSTASVTLPVKVIHHMLDLDIFRHPGQYYIFSESFMPGKSYRPPKSLSDYWHYHIVPDLHFPKEYKLYSLKDTGITKLLHKIDPLSVRDQARHSDISITNIYAQHDNEALESIRDFDLGL